MNLNGAVTALSQAQATPRGSSLLWRARVDGGKPHLRGVAGPGGYIYRDHSPGDGTGYKNRGPARSKGAIWTRRGKVRPLVRARPHDAMK